MGGQGMGRDRPRSLGAVMVGCAATQRINRETRARGRAECNAYGGVVGREGEARFKNDTDSERGIVTVSGISSRIRLRCGESDRRRIRRKTNPGNAPGLHRPPAASTREISNWQDL